MFRNSDISSQSQQNSIYLDFFVNFIVPITLQKNMKICSPELVSETGISQAVQRHMIIDVIVGAARLG